jgi:hypothetical protein
MALGEAQRLSGFGSARGTAPLLRFWLPTPEPGICPGKKRNSANEDRCLCKTPFPSVPARRRPSNGVANRTVGAVGPPDRPASRQCKMASTAESVAPCRRLCWSGLNLGEADDGACCRDRGCGQARAGLRR